MAGRLLVFLLLTTLAACGGRRDTADGERGADAPAPPLALAMGGDGNGSPDLSREPLEELTPLEPVAEPFRIDEADVSTAVAVTGDNVSIDAPMRLAEPYLARGRFAGRDVRFFSIDVDGEAQLWYLEAAGETVNRLSYHDGTGRPAQHRNADRETRRATMTNLFLAPGAHRFAVRGTGAGEYTFRAVPLGPPDPAVEREPNDEASRAHLLRMGVARTGLLFEPGDIDVYRFSLTAAEHIAVRLMPPPDLAVRLDLSETYGARGTSQIARMPGGEPGEPLVFQQVLPSGDYLVTLQPVRGGRSDHPYALRLERHDPFEPPPADGDAEGDEDDGNDGEDAEASAGAGRTDGARTAAAHLPLDLALEPVSPGFAAYWHEAQRAETRLSVANRGQATLDLTLDAAVSHAGWTVELPQSAVSVRGGQTVSVPAFVRAPPDAWADEPIAVTLRARNGEAQATGRARVQARCGLPPVGPVRAWALPDALLGGWNAAALALGAAPAVQDDRARRAQEPLYDGLTPLGEDWSAAASALPLELTVALAGAAPVPVAGVALHPSFRRSPVERARGFEVQLSMDGQSFETVLSGELGRQAVEQAFVLDEPVPARHARLRILSSHGGNRVSLAQWKVIAAPGHPLPQDGRVNLADASLGGFVAWIDPQPPTYRSVEAMLTEDVERPTLRMDPANPNEWVVGFHHNRAARIAELQWVDTPGADATPRLTTVNVAVSTESPIGPWTGLGTWELERTGDGAVAPFELPAPVWARYVRFTTTEPDLARAWQLPETLRILEQPSDGAYRSILAEWGHYSTESIYEALAARAPRTAARTGRGANRSRETAAPLASGEAESGEVLAGEAESWYRIDVPRDRNVLTLALEGHPSLRAVATLHDAQGRELGAGAHDVSSTRSVLEADVEPGATYFVRVHEPPRSIAMVWDGSGSMGAYLHTVFQALGRFSAAVRPGLEFANFLPFQDRQPRLLLADWTDQPYVLQTSLTNYDRRDASSNAEVNLLAAARHLADRPGARAIVLLTDAESPGFRTTAELWRTFEEVRPRIFSVELHGGQHPAHQQRLMQSWARLNAGHYTTFASQAEVDRAFDRAACHLRRPAPYVVSVETAFDDPAPRQLYERLMKDGRVATHGIFFDVDSDRIRPESAAVLREISDMLNRHPELRLRIEGHTDSTGSAAANQTLSERRAASVRRHLVERYGIDESRLEAAGFGESRPADTNDTPEGRQNNRRVELVRL